MSANRERYSPVVIAANGTVTLSTGQIGGFLCLTAGTITVTRNNEDGTTTVIVNAVPVTAGLWTWMPFLLTSHGGTVTLAGGASGTLGV
jgi:hypothetical protein